MNNSSAAEPGKKEKCPEEKNTTIKPDACAVSASKTIVRETDGEESITFVFIIGQHHGYTKGFSEREPFVSPNEKN